MKFVNYTMIVAVALALCACNTYPTFSPDANTMMAPVRVMNEGKYVLCQNGKRFNLPLKEEANNVSSVQVPVGEVIGLAVYTEQSTVFSVSYCTSGVNFKPVENQAYVMNNGFFENKCFAELVKQDKSKDTGVSLEPSATYYSCQP